MEEVGLHVMGEAEDWLGGRFGGVSRSCALSQLENRENILRNSGVASVLVFGREQWS